MLNNQTAWWRLWPRETRDCLFMLAVIALTVAPLMTHVPLWCSVMLAGVLLGRAALAVWRHPLPSKWWLVALLLAAVAGTWLSFRTIIGRDPGVTLVMVLLALKTLEWHRRRDAFVVFFLAFFVLLTNFFYSQSLLTALYMVLAIWGWLTALILMHRPVGSPRIRDAAKTALGMSAMGAPLVVLLFLLFPRFAPLWGTPADSQTGRTGLSGQLQIGQMAQLVQDGSIAMRVLWLDPQTRTPVKRDPAQASLYFRGPVLSEFDGSTWRATPAQPVRPSAIEPQGDALLYEVTLEPNTLRALLTLDATNELKAPSNLRASLSADMQWLSDRPLDSVIRYTALGYPNYRYTEQAPNPGDRRYTRFPGNLNPRTQALARELRSQYPNADARALSELVLDRLRKGGYSYTFEPGIYGIHAADEFWFDKKQGFCEHIAVASVILMRSMGISARLVTGYQGGERNAVDGFWTIRQSDAHAWAEVWQDGEGWIRIDPTSAVSPSRVGQVARSPVAAGVVGQAVTALLGTNAPNLLNQARALWEAANNYWNQKILSYAQSQQLSFLNQLGFESPNWQDALRLLGWMFGLSAIAGALIMRPRQSRADRWLVLLGKAQPRIVGKSTDLLVLRTTQDLSALAVRRWGSQAQAIVDWLRDMERLRYSHHTPTDIATLERQLRQLNWPT